MLSSASTVLIFTVLKLKKMSWSDRALQGKKIESIKNSVALSK
jgi:hypothetical protein